MELCKEVTSSDWTERCSISENKDNWLINGNLEGISPEWFLFPRNLQLIGHLKAGLFSLSHGPELLMLQTELRSQLETLLVWATLGMPKPLWMLGEKVSVWVMRPGRISVVSLPEFGALILSKISDSGSHLESIILNGYIEFQRYFTHCKLISLVRFLLLQIMLSMDKPACTFLCTTLIISLR